MFFFHSFINLLFHCIAFNENESANKKYLIEFDFSIGSKEKIDSVEKLNGVKSRDTLFVPFIFLRRFQSFKIIFLSVVSSIWVCLCMCTIGARTQSYCEVYVGNATIAVAADTDTAHSSSTFCFLG